MSTCPGSYCKYWMCPAVCQGSNDLCVVPGAKYSCASGSCAQDPNGLYDNCCDACNPPIPAATVKCCDSQYNCNTRTACLSGETVVSDCSLCKKPPPPVTVSCCNNVTGCAQRPACLAGENQVSDCSQCQEVKCCDVQYRTCSTAYNNCNIDNNLVQVPNCDVCTNSQYCCDGKGGCYNELTNNNTCDTGEIKVQSCSSECVESCCSIVINSSNTAYEYQCNPLDSDGTCNSYITQSNIVPSCKFCIGAPSQILLPCCNVITGVAGAYTLTDGQCPADMVPILNPTDCQRQPQFCCGLNENICSPKSSIYDTCPSGTNPVFDCNDCVPPRGVCPQFECGPNSTPIVLWSEYPGTIGTDNSLKSVYDYYYTLNRFICQTNPGNICVQKVILRIEVPVEDDGTRNVFYPSNTSVLFLNFLNNLPDNFELYALPYVSVAQPWTTYPDTATGQSDLSFISSLSPAGQEIAKAVYLVNQWNKFLGRKLFKGIVAEPLSSDIPKDVYLQSFRTVMPKLGTIYKLGCMYDGNFMSIVAADLGVTNGWDEAYPTIYNLFTKDCLTNPLTGKPGTLVDSSDSTTSYQNPSCPNYPTPSTQSLYAQAWKSSTPADTLFHFTGQNGAISSFLTFLDLIQNGFDVWPGGFDPSILNRIFPLFSVETSPSSGINTCIYGLNGGCGQRNAFGVWNTANGAQQFVKFLQMFSSAVNIPVSNCGIFTFPLVPTAWINQ